MKVDLLEIAATVGHEVAPVGTWVLLRPDEPEGGLCDFLQAFTGMAERLIQQRVDVDAAGYPVNKVDEQNQADHREKARAGRGEWGRFDGLGRFGDPQQENDAVRDGARPDPENFLMVAFRKDQRQQARTVRTDRAVDHIHYHGVGKNGQCENTRNYRRQCGTDGIEIREVQLA